MIEYPWLESPDRTEERVRGLVSSLVKEDELETVRLEWVTPIAHQFDVPDAGWVALRLTIVAVTDDDTFQREIWRPDWYPSWEHALGELADALEDWVCETRFAWGQRRSARIPD